MIRCACASDKHPCNSSDAKAYQRFFRHHASAAYCNPANGENDYHLFPGYIGYDSKRNDEAGESIAVCSDRRAYAALANLFFGSESVSACTWLSNLDDNRRGLAPCLESDRNNGVIIGIQQRRDEQKPVPMFRSQEGDYSASASISSSSSLKSASASLIGLAVVISTPAILSREMGSVLLPELRNFL